MALTKAEKERLAELEAALALHWPSYAAPAPMTREEVETAKVAIPCRDKSARNHGRRMAAVGWFVNDYQDGRITKGWSDGVSHNRESEYGDHASQAMGVMYRSQTEAAMALRLALSRKYARALAAVDRIVRGEP